MSLSSWNPFIPLNSKLFKIYSLYFLFVLVAFSQNGPLDLPLFFLSYCLHLENCYCVMTYLSIFELTYSLQFYVNINSCHLTCTGTRIWIQWFGLDDWECRIFFSCFESDNVTLWVVVAIFLTEEYLVYIHGSRFNP